MHWQVNLGIRKAMRIITFEQFKESYTKLGNVAGYEKGTKLPYSGEVILADDLGKVTLRYVTEDGKVLRMML